MRRRARRRRPRAATPWRSAAGRNSRATCSRERAERRPARARARSSRRRAARGRAGRWSSFVRRSTCSRIVRDELVARLGVELLVLEQLDEAAEREDRRAQLVRGVGDELLAGAVEPRQPALHLVERQRELAELVRRSRPGSASRSCRPRPPPRPARGASAAARARSPRVAGEQRERQRDRARDQDLALDQRDVVLDLVERLREHDHPRRPPARGQRRRRLARRRWLPTSSTAELAAPVRGGVDRRDVSAARPRRARTRSRRSRTPGSRRRRTGIAEQRHPRAGLLAERRERARRSRACDARARSRARSRGPWSAAAASSASSFCEVRFDSSCGTT